MPHYMGRRMILGPDDAARCAIKQRKGEQTNLHKAGSVFDCLPPLRDKQVLLPSGAFQASDLRAICEILVTLSC